MKRILFTSVLLVGLAVTSGQAANENIVAGMGNKAVRGVIDLATGIVELPMQTCKGYKKGCGPIKNKPLSKTVGTVLGIFRGLSHSAARIGGGDDGGYLRKLCQQGPEQWIQFRGAVVVQ